MRTSAITLATLLVGCVGDPPDLPTFNEPTSASSDPSMEASSSGEPPVAETGADTSTSGAPEPSTSSSGDPSLEESSVTTAVVPEPFCGDGSVDPDETCDDGNDDNTDACTTLCEPPSCADEIVSGDETGLDCGGSCAPCQACMADAECGVLRVCDTMVCRLPRTCAELYSAHPTLRYGGQLIQPQEGGPTADVLCVEDEDGGAAWTRVFEETAADGAHPNWQLSGSGIGGAAAFQCGALGWVFGLFGSGANVQISVPLLDVQHTEVRTAGEVLVADTWDSEQIAVSIDGQQVWSEICLGGGPVCNLNITSHCGIGAGDGLVEFDGRRSHITNTATLRFSANINSFQNDESFGVGTFGVLVR